VTVGGIASPENGLWGTVRGAYRGRRRLNQLTDRVVLITGARGGVGTHVTKAFLEAGGRVVGSSRGIADSEFANPKFSGIPADLTSAADARKLADAVVERFGKLDVLVHVAGGFEGGSPIHETGDATWERMLDVNLRAAVHILSAVIPHMRHKKHGRIVAVASRAGVEPAPNVGAYSASKAALVSLVRTAALENRDFGITANVLLPGMIDTEANRQSDPAGDRSKWLSPQRLAQLMVFLASDAAAEITGAAIPVYGTAL
jgi:NAD(P)-dependent dehydrogenase (short-subunit alcohol dehydrogenase family)